MRSVGKVKVKEGGEEVMVSVGRRGRAKVVGEVVCGRCGVKCGESAKGTAATIERRVLGAEPLTSLFVAAKPQKEARNVRATKVRGRARGGAWRGKGEASGTETRKRAKAGKRASCQIGNEQEREMRHRGAEKLEPPHGAKTSGKGQTKGVRKRPIHLCAAG